MSHHIDTLYKQARRHPEDTELWDELRTAERSDLPTCVNHPGRATAGRFDDEAYGYCHECVEAELRRRRLWLASFRLVQGGVEALR